MANEAEYESGKHPDHKEGEGETEATNEDLIKVSVSATQKVNLGNYESADVFVALSNIDSGAAEDDMLMALETGELAFSCVKKFISDKVQEIRTAVAQ